MKSIKLKNRGLRLRFVKNIVFGFIWLCASSGLWAQQKMSGQFNHQPLIDVLQSIEKEQSLVFSYTQEIVAHQFVTAVFDEVRLDRALTLILESTTIDFEIVNATYVVLHEKEGSNTSLTICGKIIDSKQNPLPFANVWSKNSKTGTSALEDGTFHWTNLLLPNDSILISYVGFQTQSLQAKDLQSCPTIQLDFAQQTFSEVLVKEYILSGIEQSEQLNHLILRPQKIDVVPGLTEADVLQMVQILPGVQSPDESATNLHIRGGTPDQNLILWDGVPIYNGGHFFGMLSAFNPYIVDQVKVFRGNFDTEYGGRVAGVIDISSENKIPSRLQLNTGINFTHADLALTIPFAQQKSAIVLSARRAYTDIIETPTYRKLSGRVFQKGKINEQQTIVGEGEDNLDLNLDFVFNDLNFKYLYHPNQKDQLAFSAFGIFDRLQFLSETIDENIVETDDLDLQNIGWSAQWNRQWNNRLSMQMRLAYTDLKNDYQFNLDNENSLDFFERAQRNDIRDWNFHWNNKWQWSSHSQLKWGYQFSDLSVGRTVKWTFEDDTESLLNTSQIHSFHLKSSTAISQQVKLEFGTRYNAYRLTQTDFWEPRFSFFYLPNQHWQFKFSAGIYQQFISQVVELNDLGFNEQLWVLANEEEGLPIVRNQSLSIGALFHRPDFQFEVEAYRKKLSNLTSVSPAFIDSFQDIFDIGTGEVLGLDLLLKKRWSAYQTWLSYSYTQVNYEFVDINFEEPFSAPHERPHSLTWVHLWEHQHWQLATRWTLASGKVFTEARGFEMRADDMVVLYEEDAINQERLPSYHRLDFSLLYKIQPKNPRMEGMIGFSILNAYNRQNLLSRQYIVDYDDEEEAYELAVLDRPLLGFTPNLVFRWAWK